MGIVSFMRGFADIEISGRRVERFVNLCAERGIEFKNFEHTGNDSASARLYWRDYRRLMKSDMSSAGLAIKRIGLFGTPAVAGKAKGRWLLLGAAALCAAALVWASGFVWRIEISGNETISAGEILIAMEEEGVTLGTKVSSVDSYALRNRMLLRVDKLIWFSVNMRGSTAHVQVRERKEKPELIDMTEKTQVVAKRDGLVTEVRVLSGVGKVQRGMTVAEGDVLITGEAVDVREETRYLYASGEVWARTWYTLRGEMPLACGEKVYTGEKLTVRTLMFGKKGIKLSLKSGIPFASCDKMINVKEFDIFGIMALPISLMTETYYPYDIQPGEIPRAEAEKMLEESLYEQLLSLLDEGEVSAWNINFREKNGVLLGTLYGECLEQIGVGTKLEPTPEDAWAGKE